MASKWWRIGLGILAVLSGGESILAQGPILQAGGPVHRSMGGASVAAPIDAIGAIYWNPASISGMERSETSFGLDFLFVNHAVSSSVGSIAGETEGDAGAFAIPNVGWVHKTQNERITLGVGVNAIAGFGTNLPADPSNPILAPAPTGLGQISSNALFLQIAPIVSLAVTDNLAVAAGPTITTGRLSLEPFVLDAANADGTYSTGHATRYHWGGGFQFGTYYIYDDAWRFGASLKSPTWMENFEYNAEDENGLPRILTASIDLPLIFSVGTSCTLDDKTLLAWDVRYLDFANTDGLGDPAVFDATGALGGLDYSSIVATALGLQRKVSDLITVRGGYTYNQNPIKNSEAFYNIASPVIYQHMLSGGASLNFSELLSANVAYSYYFENTRSGQIVLPGIGTVPGSTFSNTMDAHLLSFGITVRN
jgi:long-chain fatty acid transport protein